ncbi:alpha/beta hydrolase [Galbitalea sp. SE-J8]|uniref:alpha/beta hydrolase n=1 Tax=Galbitalea sp. SE-J8 TaxID=3054952 RepID=UPI00259CA40A|nr:alpha/beta hydrolase [Galbitalea sp. SE-J8]MDM4763606.1 alpha/beta hydrolase [Galbitalea sp. SE-J8]
MLHSVRRAAVAAALVVVLPLSVASLGACTLIPSPGAPLYDDPGLSAFYEQAPHWSACADAPTLDCATLTAPLDWSKPDGDTIHLAVIRARATGRRIGTVFVNPGGPGASGVQWLENGASAAVNPAVAESFDVVSWDPRGAGASSAVNCGSDAELDHFFYDVHPEEPELGTDAWFAWQEQQDGAFAQACLDGTGDLLGHISTTDSARDLDLLRGVMRDEHLTYVGYSAGTLLGAIYAQLFPQRTGRLVLDGAIDPSVGIVQSVANQTKGFEQALRSYLTWCLGQDACPFTGTVDDAVADIQKLYDALDAHPLTADDGRELGADTMRTAVDAMLYAEENWPYLSDGFRAAFEGDANYPFRLADYYNDRDDSGHYTSNLMVAFPAIMCLDYPSTATPDGVRADIAADTNSYLFADDEPGYAAMGCNGWPFAATRTPAPITAPGSSDILVIGTTGDPATPYQEAVDLAGELAHGHLVTYTGEGHTAYNGGSTCVDGVVDAYLLHGTVPASDPQC